MIINDVYLDFNALNKAIINENQTANRLKKIYELVGGEFWDVEKTLLKGAKVFLCGVGGLLLENKDNHTYLMNKQLAPGVLYSEIIKMAGASSFMSYLNSGNLDLQELGEKTVNVYEHTSVLHTINLNILIIGHSIGVEHELASQRDLVHLSRLTVSKTNAQNNPCLILRNKDYMHIYQTVLKDIKLKLNDDMTDKETKNLIFPTAKSSMVLLSGSLKNFNKLISIKDSDGKEDEFVDILESIKSVLNKALIKV